MTRPCFRDDSCKINSPCAPDALPHDTLTGHAQRPGGKHDAQSPPLCGALETRAWSIDQSQRGRNPRRGSTKQKCAEECIQQQVFKWGHRQIIPPTWIIASGCEKETPTVAETPRANRSPTYAYDAFCRLYDYRNKAIGHYQIVSYANDGNPAAQYWQVLTPVPGGNYSSFVRSYYGGRGRVWREQQRGDAAADPYRTVDTVYDARNNVTKKSAPYFVGGTAYFTESRYDWADRTLAVINPDGSQKTYYYYLTNALSYTTNVPHAGARVIDEEGRYTYTFQHAGRTPSHPAAQCRERAGRLAVHEL